MGFGNIMGKLGAGFQHQHTLAEWYVGMNQQGQLTPFRWLQNGDQQKFVAHCDTLGYTSVQGPYSSRQAAVQANC
jgi:hypothetical protein